MGCASATLTFSGTAGVAEGGALAVETVTAVVSATTADQNLSNDTAMASANVLSAPLGAAIVADLATRRSSASACPAT